MYAIEGGRRVNDTSQGFARLYADVFDRPLLVLARPQLRLLAGGAAATARARPRGCGRTRRHLRIVDGARR